MQTKIGLMLKIKKQVGSEAEYPLNWVASDLALTGILFCPLPSIQGKNSKPADLGVGPNYLWTATIEKPWCVWLDNSEAVTAVWADSVVANKETWVSVSVQISRPELRPWHLFIAYFPYL